MKLMFRNKSSTFLKLQIFYKQDTSEINFRNAPSIRSIRDDVFSTRIGMEKITFSKLSFIYARDYFFITWRCFHQTFWEQNWIRIDSHTLGQSIKISFFYISTPNKTIYNKRILLFLRIWLNLIADKRYNLSQRRDPRINTMRGYQACSFLSCVLRREGVFNRSERTEPGPHYFLGQPSKVDINDRREKKKN